MPLTPADVRNVAFSKPSIGKRGYKEDEVDVFLDLVGAELARLIEANKDLRDEIERLDQQLCTALAGAGPTVCPLNDSCTRAETLDRQSRANAESLERDSVGKHTEIGAAAPAGLTCTQQGFAAHHLIPNISAIGAGLPQAVHMSVGNGPPDRGVANKPDTRGTPWQPAV